MERTNNAARVMFKWPSIQRRQCPIHNGTFETDQTWRKFWRFYRFKRVCYDNSKGLACWKNAQIVEKSKLKKVFKIVNIDSNSFLNRQSFKRYRCESSIAIFVWRATWYYVYSSFKFYISYFFNCEHTIRV